MSAPHTAAFAPPAFRTFLPRQATHPSATPLRARHARFLTHAQAPPPESPPPEGSSRRENDLLERLAAIPDAERTPEQTPLSDTRGRLNEAARYLQGPLFADFERFLDRPSRLLSAAALAILFGFFSATSASTIIGSVADWDPLAAAVLLVWTEGFTKVYYGREKKSRLLQLINGFKIGLIYGMTVDAFKLST